MYGFGYAEATVVCRQLGYPYANEIYSDYDVTPIEGALYYTSITCLGNPMSIAECIKVEETDTSCFPYIGVKCLPGKGFHIHLVALLRVSHNTLD